MKGELKFANVVFKYRDGNKKILDDLNLDVKAGKTIAIVGESGSGKSTIINLVTGFDYCDEVVISIDGIDIKKIDLQSYRKQIAVVLQNSILFSETIRDNITYGSSDVSKELLDQIIDLSCLRVLLIPCRTALIR